MLYVNKRQGLDLDMLYVNKCQGLDVDMLCVNNRQAVRFRHALSQ